MLRNRPALLLLAPLLALTAACGSSGPGDDTAAGTTPTGSPTSSASASSTGTPAGSPTSSATGSPTAPSSIPTAAAAGTCAYPTDGKSAARKVKAPSTKPAAGSPKVTIATNAGDIEATLDATRAPCTVNSFLSLAGQGYFDGTDCHRLTTDGIYVLQCGDPTGTGAGGPGYSFDDELIPHDARIAPCKKMSTQMGPQEICTYPAGTLAMANAGADTNGSQFFLVYRDSPLPNAYTVFGRMNASGLKVVQTIAKRGLANGAQGDGGPKDPVTIISVKPTR